MNLGKAKDKALALIAEYSIDGSKISVSENADYLNRMNEFASDAQMEISDKIPIDAVFTYEQASTGIKTYNKIPLPEDFKELRFVNLNDERLNNYRIENNNLIIRDSISGTIEISYSKNPTELSETTEESYEFEVDKHVHHLIPYFMGGMAVHDENPTISDRLLNMYYTKLGVATKRNIEHPNSIGITYSI
jgi:hypothetical protein